MNKTLSVRSDFNLVPSLGAILVTVIISAALWGITCMQTFLYFINYPEDRRSLKLLVIWLWMLDTTHQIALTALIYAGAIIHFGNYQYFLSYPSDSIWQYLLASLVEATAQSFFAYRIWLFSNKKWFIPVVFLPAILSHLALNIVWVVEGIDGNSAATELQTGFVMHLTFINQGMSCALDVSLAAIFTFLLRKNAPRHDFRSINRSNRMIHRLSILSLVSGFWPAMLSLAIIVTLAVLPRYAVWTGMLFLQCPMYCNTVLANLNARTYIACTDDIVFNISALSQSRKVDGSIQQPTTVASSETIA